MFGETARRQSGRMNLDSSDYDAMLKTGRGHDRSMSDFWGSRRLCRSVGIPLMFHVQCYFEIGPVMF